jgi:predicted nucleic acid-binding protein
VTVGYLDSSAIVKLAVDETESSALRRWVTEHAANFTSRVAHVEVPRALRRKGPVSVELGRDALDHALGALSVIELDASIAETAAGLSPDGLRSMDAIHLASALSVASELEAFVTYDLRLADAARAAGLAVVVPA